MSVTWARLDHSERTTRFAEQGRNFHGSNGVTNATALSAFSGLSIPKATRMSNRGSIL